MYFLSDVPISPIDEDMIPATFIEQPKRNICKICAKEFDTQDELKTHMLTHNGEFTENTIRSHLIIFSLSLSCSPPPSRNSTFLLRSLFILYLL